MCAFTRFGLFTLLILNLCIYNAAAYSRRQRRKRQAFNFGSSNFGGNSNFGPPAPQTQFANQAQAMEYCLGWAFNSLIGKTFGTEAVNNFQYNPPPPVQPSNVPSFLNQLNPEVLSKLSPEEKQAVEYMNWLAQLEKQRLRRSDPRPHNPSPIVPQRPQQPSLFKALPSGGQIGPKRQFVVDTGDNFDRFVIHQVNGYDAMGIPVHDKMKSTGLVWGDGDLEIINSDSKNFLGNPYEEHRRGFKIPVASIMGKKSSEKSTRSIQRDIPQRLQAIIPDSVDWGEISNFKLPQLPVNQRK